MTILELNDLIKILEEKYNINSNLLGSSVQSKDNISDKQEKINYSVFLVDIGINKISVIKLIREITNLGLREAKNLVESFPVLIKENIDLNLAENIKKKLEDVGSKIEIK